MKQKLLKKIVITTITLILMVTVFFILFFQPKHKISTVGAKVNESLLIDDLKVLGGKYLKVNNIHIYFNGVIMEETVKEEDGSIDRNSRIIDIATTNKKLWTKISKPYEVNQAMRTWIYLIDRKLPFEVAGVFSLFQEKGVVSEARDVLISKIEFEELYKEVYRSELSEEQLIVELSDLWISKTNHKKWWAD